MSETPIYSGMAGSSVAPPPPVNSGEQNDLDARIEALLEARLSAVESKYKAQIDALQAQLTQARGRPGEAVIPFNSGGQGTEVAQTWSQYHQDLANQGKLTPAHLDVTYGRVPQDA